MPLVAIPHNKHKRAQASLSYAQCMQPSFWTAIVAALAYILVQSGVIPVPEFFGESVYMYGGLLGFIVFLVSVVVLCPVQQAL